MDQARFASFAQKRPARYANVAADGCLSYCVDYALNGTAPAVYTLYGLMAREKDGLQAHTAEGSMPVYLQVLCYYTLSDLAK